MGLSIYVDTAPPLRPEWGMILEMILLSMFGSKKGKKDSGKDKKGKDTKKSSGKPDKKDAGKGKKGR